MLQQQESCVTGLLDKSRCQRLSLERSNSMWQQAGWLQGHEHHCGSAEPDHGHDRVLGVTKVLDFADLIMH